MDKRSREWLTWKQAPNEGVLTSYQCSQFRTVPAGTADMFCTGALNGTETSSFRIGLSTDNAKSVPAVPVEIRFKYRQYRECFGCIGRNIEFWPENGYRPETEMQISL